MAVITGFEYYLSTGAPVVGAAVDYWPAVVGTPGGASSGSTTTDGNGRWTFSPATGVYDVRVVLGARTRWYKGLSATTLQELYINGALRVGGAAIFDGLVTLNAGISLVGGSLAGFPMTKLGEGSVSSGSTCGVTIATGSNDWFLALFHGYHNGIALGGATVGKLLLRLNSLSDAHYDSQKTTVQQATTVQTESLNANEWDVGMIPGNTNLGRDGVCAVLFGADFFQSWFSWNTQQNPSTGQVRHGHAAGSRDAGIGGALTRVDFAIESSAVFGFGQMNVYGLG